MSISRLTAVLAVAALLLVPSAAATLPSKGLLEREKLQEEVRQLRHQNDRAASVFGEVLDLAPFVTVLVAVAAVVIPLLNEARKRRAERERDYEQRRSEERQRFDGLFAQAVGNLGSDNESVGVAGALTLDNFLRPDYADFHEQVYAVLCANLAVKKHTPLVNRFLVRGFEHAIRVHLEHVAGDDEETIDLARCRLYRVRLTGLVLPKLDIAFATLDEADLRNATLFRARGIDASLKKARFSDAKMGEVRFNGANCSGAHFHDAVLVSAEFRESNKQRANLTGAEFYRASLQGAHFDNADLSQARFDNANVNDAHFPGAIFDATALRSLLKTQAVGRNAKKPIWERAHFDEQTTASLKGLAP